MADIEIIETEDVLIINAPNLHFGFQPNQILHVTGTALHTNDLVVDDCSHIRTSFNTPGPQHCFDKGEYNG